MTDEAAAPSRPRSYAKGVARRQEILDRAIEVFADKGAEGTSLRAIAEKIGVSHAALLHYFGSREELLLEVLRESEVRHGSSRDKQEVVGTMVRAAERNVGIPGFVSLYTSMLAGSLDADRQASREYFGTRFARIRERLAQLIRDGQHAGTFRRGVDPEAMAALVIAASDGLQIQWLLEPEVDIARSLELLERILEP
ncbi:TetR/AcrR family transcriptional regulator [Microbacterium pygmaeum]|uniref:DNA-binding transcriptional regulator, AcrR family n=1 Tax=Microbacterium pygmaeum TaxID=370764 RepID=A0A1G7WES4_9MICO|nr:TetR/AcrR family transcriptional regulator [Microbacterium pygmaeum]SDG70239.1 DNA-binding transcriptional regulator, AcrR family [Microbacterium pygmaeum]